MNRFQNHLLTFARAFWLAFLLFKWVYWIASMPRFFALVNAGRRSHGDIGRSRAGVSRALCRRRCCLGGIRSRLGAAQHPRQRPERAWCSL